MSRTPFSRSFVFCSLVYAVGVLSASRAVAKPSWFQQESEHFIVVYRESHAHLVPHILRSAENALRPLMILFNYQPSEKIVINTYDFSDYGAAGTTTVPHNFIRLEIEPLELGYENIPYNERLQWLIGHELVHVVVNDQASKAESFSRSIFSKVPPEKNQPLSIVYSLITNFGRYTPRWHQEGIAVFMETWLSGGYGRTLGNFDEMYFRSLVLEEKPFASPEVLDAKVTNVSFLLQMLYYLYGGRFVSYLAATHGTDKVLNWFTAAPEDAYLDFETRFRSVFGVALEEEWDSFTRTEQRFQKENLRRLRSSPLTRIFRLGQKPLGWVAQPYLDSSGKEVLFGYHQPHHLTKIARLDLRNRNVQTLGSLPSPSIIQVASTAYDPELGFFFYTTNNNQLYRDVWVLSTATGTKRLLFQDSRVGHLTVSPGTHELWGVSHDSGLSTLVYSPYPYRTLYRASELPFGDELQHLAVSPSGRLLAATLHRADGTQAIVLAESAALRRGEFRYQVISEQGSPEHPSWSSDDSTLYWNAYTNGVSNIYRYRFVEARVEAVSHTLRGLFRPLYVNEDALFAFEFTTEGFVPVIIPNRVAPRLPAIRYFGQQIVELDPEVVDWALRPAEEAVPEIPALRQERDYRGISHLQVHSLIPVLSGFQNQRVIGLFTHVADPLFVHDVAAEVGVSPFNELAPGPDFHAKIQYEYRRRLKLGIEHNAPNFYDLFNERKRGMIGTRISLGHTRYWKYDNPHKISQTSEIAAYTGIEAINDNLVRVSRPDFFVLQTALHSRNLRRSIGSSDVEAGTEWKLSLMTFLVDPRRPAVVGGIHAEWDRFFTVAWPHNVLHVKTAAGIRYTKEELAIGRFYFGGFGNRRLEDGGAKQFRKVFRFPGIPIYSLSARGFAKAMVEQNLPPLRFDNLGLGSHLLTHVDASWYAQGLVLDSDLSPTALSVGGQVNLVFKNWFNLESTLSAGIARAWIQGDPSWAWVVSFKLLKG